jgi:predicted NUDIX family phosphoesterase
MGMDEEVLVVPRVNLLWQGAFRGVRTDGLDEYVARARRFGQFRRRADVEEDPSLKQIIPYLVVRSGRRFMLYRRTQVGQEPRLRGLYSIGVGGHISKNDVEDALDVVAAGLRRELEEELKLDGGWSARLVGVLNEEDTAVSRVHFGLVHMVDVPSGRVAIRETDRLTGQLASLDAIRHVYGQMETWSQRVVDGNVLTTGEPQAARPNADTPNAPAR